MRFFDLIRMSSSNLWRRKLRTFLTVLGVVIGTASIIVMVSIGIGQNRSLMAAIEKSGSLTAVEVYNSGGGMVSFGSGTSTSSGEQLMLNDSMIETFLQIPHVTSVSPQLRYTVIMKQGAYIHDYASFYGVTREVLEKIPLGEGRLPDRNADSLEFVVGNNIITDFVNEKTQEYYWQTGKIPDVDFMGQPMFTIFDRNAYYESLNGQGQAPKKYLLHASGLVEGDVNTWNNYSYGIYCDIDALKDTLKKIFRNKPIPGQPTQKNGKPYPEFSYDQAVVNVDKMENVKDVLAQIQEIGFQAHSNAEYMETMQKQSQTTQLVLGGIGAVSLFVAAIGIANTMMMSIYERTKEIGILKVLGCAMGNIRTLFLLEAAFIGFFGGLLGVGISYGISSVVNKVAGNMYGNMYGSNAETTISYIPPWLALAALGFAVLIGIISGFLPALRAMKLSPLAAIRNE